MLILIHDNKSLIVLSGDFNAIAIKKTSWLSELGVEPIVPDDEATHNRGGHLD